MTKIFQSTLPTRGSDCADAKRSSATSRISIHAPHEGERQDKGRQCRPKGEFQSTLPTRGSDGANPARARGEATISIHAPHEGERLL